MKAPSALLLLLLVGCGQSTSEAPPAEAAEAPPESAFEPLTDTLDRARSVEDTLAERAEARRRQLEEAEGR